MKFIVTGGAGFVGSNMVKYLNSMGFNDIVIIDNYKNKKMENIHNLIFTDYIDFTDGIEVVIRHLECYADIKAFFHIGANADVLDYNEKRVMQMNFEFSRAFVTFCTNQNIPFIYASSSAVYGNSKHFTVINENEHPHSTYSWSKWLFDKYIINNYLNISSVTHRIYGFRFFNVFGVGEFHKGKNACIANRFVSFIKEKGFIDLFDKKISRDYVYVEDLCEVLYKTFTNSENIGSGIYNLGGGNSISHREIAEMVIDMYNRKGKLNRPSTEYLKLIPMPAELEDKFQFFTLAENLEPYIADITKDNKEKMCHYIELLIDMDYCFKE